MKLEVDPEYPGTAVARMRAARERVQTLSSADLSGEWESVRQRILWAAGLKDIKHAAPGRGYTGHAFNKCSWRVHQGQLLRTIHLNHQPVNDTNR